MRTKEEVIKSADIKDWGISNERAQVQATLAIVEVLIDIRDLLVEANRVDITSNGMGDGRGGDGIGKALYVAGRTLCGKIYPSGQESCNNGACKVCYPTN